MSVSYQQQIHRLLTFAQEVFDACAVCTCPVYASLRRGKCFRCRAFELLHDEPVRFRQTLADVPEVLNPKYPRYL